MYFLYTTLSEIILKIKTNTNYKFIKLKEIINYKYIKLWNMK